MFLLYIFSSEEDLSSISLLVVLVI